MSLKSSICDILHHTCRNQTHCPTMILSFKLSLGTVCYPGFVAKLVVYKEKKLVLDVMIDANNSIYF